MEMEEEKMDAASTPQGDGEFVVRDGDCMASIAFDYGFVPDTIWNHRANASLKSGRKDQKVLLPGDRVHIPERQSREVACATDLKHTFIRKGLCETLRIVLLDEDGNPRPGLHYVLCIDRKIVKSDMSSSQGLIETPILPNARAGKLIVKGEEAEEVYELRLGSLDPIESVTGVQARLNNLGYYCGQVDGIAGQLTRAAVREFQADHNLSATGKINEETRNALSGEHGF
ncbi:MAG TPA: peptidoglycan-binding domain-containing protein [Bryobacteraceae bacterium]